MTTKTVPEVFIIESLKFGDERRNRQEGEVLARMLALSGKTDTRYYYLRTRKELAEVIERFGRSRYRYLHISCHADLTGMATTLDEVSYEDLGEMLAPHLDGRRVFVSGCEMACDRLAAALLNNTGCYSLVGPAGEIAFSDATAMWIAFYRLMFKADRQRMQRGRLASVLGPLSALFHEPFNFYRGSDASRAGYQRVKLQD